MPSLRQLWGGGAVVLGELEGGGIPLLARHLLQEVLEAAGGGLQLPDELGELAAGGGHAAQRLLAEGHLLILLAILWARGLI
ncbi:MAG: hypothetical protein HY532_00595 [Chloroflexi bacterium]|nr:hypothetical protein [Chloroflexota bacterium]